MASSGLIPGDVLVAKNIRVSFASREVRGWADMKCPKGKVGIFLLLDVVDEKKVDEFDPVKKLEEMGYIKSPDFVQSERDKELTAKH